MPKYYILTLGQSSRVSALEPSSLESPFDADVKLIHMKCYEA